MSRRPHSGSALGAALLLVLGGCAGTRTSEQVPLRPGDRVRLTAPSVVKGEVKGQVQEVSTAEILLSVPPEQDLVIPADALGSLAIQRGTRRRVKEGALIGLGAGAVAFMAILASEGGCGSGDAMCQTGMGLAVGVLAGGGALLGTLVGLLVETEVWEDQTLPLAVEATADGLRVEFRLPVGRTP